MRSIFKAVIATPIGDLLALASEHGLCALEFGTKDQAPRTKDQAPRTKDYMDLSDLRPRLGARMRRWFPDARIVDLRTPALDRTRAWADAYFAGTSADVDGLPLDLRGAPFELRVWQALLEIPAGTTSTYGEIAKRLGAPGASRAVGAANGANPVSLIVPCHRVIGSSGALTGYGGGLDRKRWLLNHEARWRVGSQRELFAETS